MRSAKNSPSFVTRSSRERSSGTLKASYAARNASDSRRSNPRSSIVRSTPRHARRKAYGSVAPVGASPIAKHPTSVSSRSAIATSAPASVPATVSPAPLGW